MDQPLEFFNAFAASPYGQVFMVAYRVSHEKALEKIADSVRVAASDYAQQPRQDGDTWYIDNSNGQVKVCWIIPSAQPPRWEYIHAFASDYDARHLEILRQLEVNIHA
jgi:hypothetical protein